MERKWKAKAIPSNIGIAPMEEDAQEEEFMEDNSPPQRGPNGQEDDETFPHYSRPRRADVEEVKLPKKANTILIAPRIPENVPLLVDIMSKSVKLKFEDLKS